MKLELTTDSNESIFKSIVQHDEEIDRKMIISTLFNEFMFYLLKHEIRSKEQIINNINHYEMIKKHQDEEL